MSWHWVSMRLVAAYSLVVICCRFSWRVWGFGLVSPWGVILPRYCWVILRDRFIFGSYLLVIL